jgi:integrase
LAAETINKTLKLLGQILDVAEERELVARNPLRVNPRRRKLKVRRPSAVWLDRAHQIDALLEAAGQLDREAREDRRHVGRKAILATLTFAGLRIGELCDLRWRDVELGAGRLRVRRSKTDAGTRYVDLLPALRDELAAHRAGHTDAGQLTPVFATSHGGRMSERNIAQRVLEPAIARANELLEDDGHAPLPEGLTLHKLRHTCCSLLFVCGYELPRVMAMLGHADATTTLRVYAHVMAAGDEDREALRQLVRGADWAANGQQDRFRDENPARSAEGQGKQKPRMSGASL